MDNVQYIAENFECPVCGQKFAQVWDAFGHLNDKHPAGEQTKEE
uniref:C2H2-type domain-containing protein n=1 Tax=viral metagenome TaxID=1070528 RepID=A0A6H1ZTC8_9ZZZZ